MFRWSRARYRAKPGASPRVVRGAREPCQQGREAEVWGPPAGRGRAQPGVRPARLRRLHAEADQHQGRPGGRQLDGDGALNLYLLHHQEPPSEWKLYIQRQPTAEFIFS